MERACVYIKNPESQTNYVYMEIWKSPGATLNMESLDLIQTDH